MTGDMSSVVPRCAPLPRSRAGGAPPASAPLLGNRVCIPICPLSYFVTKASGCVLRLEARLLSVHKCQTCLLPQPAAAHARAGARARAPPAGLRTGPGGPCRLARRASAGERPRGLGAGKAWEHRSEASRSTVPSGPGQREAPLPGMRRSEACLRQEAPGAGAQEPATLGRLSHCSSRKSSNVLRGPEEAPGKSSSTSRDIAQWSPSEQRFGRHVLPSEAFGQTRITQDDELSTVLRPEERRVSSRRAAALKPVVAERLPEPERPPVTGAIQGL
ncbi:unnamed protein product [Rangifer tarandus platyrhynchus]|uniref:Uncharacterized protein n=3 Tax=Rangifer tarandus platyrhynchus TaxID=3082113 RepID=A0ABN8XTP9_RANTA|nr:unnamed protein product [Rangifer tarandus platyrhynchus]CAI9151578.1 unnamed protein product [Rangifer tarandus platyrhynchus]CAI9151579.1 unnamed protein product [Rangifer tarandus platyrhynchus]CAI9691159.1 unnamed protein product [Rangifer tarandus platyrhynchus]CAI9691160.1 unnamed protein product [Rangifer tarandus platyrhynchus]